MDNKKIRIGVMGAAAIAKRSVIPAIKSLANFELVAIASRTAQKAEQFAAQFACAPVTGYPNLLTQPIDAVYVPLPTGLHEEWITACLHAGKHVFAEKSFGLNYASTQRLANLAREKKLVIMENFMFEYHSQHLFLMQLLNDGAIGTIRNFTASFGFPPLAEGNFRYDAALGGGALLDAGGYPIKAAQIVLGTELEMTGAAMQYDEQKKIDVAGSAYFLYNGATTVQLIWGFNHFYTCGYDIWGTKGRITTNRSFTSAEGFQPSLKLELNGETREYKLAADNHFKNILSTFAGNIYSGNYDAAANAIERQSKLMEQVRTGSRHYSTTL